MVRLAAVGDGLDPCLAPDVSGVDADFGRAVFRCLDGEPVVKVNVGNRSGLAGAKSSLFYQAFRFGTPSIAGNEKESYSPETPKNAAQTKQIGLIRKQIRSGCDGKALAPGHDHAVLTAGAVDDEEIAHAVVAADDPDVAVIRVKDEIAGQRV